MSRRVFCRFCHARSRVATVFGPLHYCALCERAAPDAPETIDDQRRCTGCRYRTIYCGSRGSASLPVIARTILEPAVPRTKIRQRQPVRLLLTRHSLDLNSEITAVLAWIGLTVTE